MDIDENWSVTFRWALTPSLLSTFSPPLPSSPSASSTASISTSTPKSSSAQLLIQGGRLKSRLFFNRFRVRIIQEDERIRWLLYNDSDASAKNTSLLPSPSPSPTGNIHVCMSLYLGLNPLLQPTGMDLEPEPYHRHEFQAAGDRKGRLGEFWWTRKAWEARREVLGTEGCTLVVAVQSFPLPTSPSLTEVVEHQRARLEAEDLSEERQQVLDTLFDDPTTADVVFVFNKGTNEQKRLFAHTSVLSIANTRFGTMLSKTDQPREKRRASKDLISRPDISTFRHVSHLGLDQLDGESWREGSDGVGRILEGVRSLASPPLMTSGMVSPVPTPIPKPGHPTGKERDSNHHTSPLSLRTSKQYDERSIERTSYCSFWSLVRYLYVRQVSLSPEDAKEVYCLAVEYDVPGLKDAAKAAVINALTTTTVVEELMGWASGGKWERAEIRREMIEYLKIHWEEVKLANQGAGGTWFEICEVLAGQ